MSGALQAEGGDEVLVQFEPCAVAGVAVHGGDPYGVDLCPGQRGGEPFGVAAEPGQVGDEAVLELDEHVRGLSKLGDGGRGRHAVEAQHRDLVLGAGVGNPVVEWQEPLVDLLDDGPGVAGVELRGEQAFAVGLPGFGERPAVVATELGADGATTRFVVQQVLQDLMGGGRETLGELVDRGVAANAKGVEQVQVVGGCTVHRVSRVESSGVA